VGLGAAHAGAQTASIDAPMLAFGSHAGGAHPCRPAARRIRLAQLRDAPAPLATPVLLAAAALLATVALLAALALAPARALASDTEPTMLMDDQQLIYDGSSHAIRVLHQLHALGVDTVKVSLVWALVAPDPNSTHRPSFDATNPADYPYGAWDRWDLIDAVAHQLGMSVSFQIIGPAPAWARGTRVADQGKTLGRFPNQVALRQFVEAAGRRYSGSYVPNPAADGSSPGGVVSVPLPTVGGAMMAHARQAAPSTAFTLPPGQALPRVSSWEVWNEPDEADWLNPWYARSGRRTVYIEAAEYRRILSAVWTGLHDTGHGSDTILIGETANVGVRGPAFFTRALYCVGADNRPLSGAAAAALDCPTSPDPAQFVARNPGLFGASGFAHHPYGFNVPPNRPYTAWPGFITLDNLGVLERMLNGIFAAYGQTRRGGVPLYVTEWGYDSDPPNPYNHTSLAEQAAWINQGEFETWQMPYVRDITQFLLVDDTPKAGAPRGSHEYWSTFQTGLEFQNGRAKPSYWAFMLPIWVPNPHSGPHVTVWGQLRPAAHTTLQDGVLQYEPRGSHRFATLAQVQTGSPEGFFVARPAIPRAGLIRLAWTSPSGTTYYSRTVAIG